METDQSKRKFLSTVAAGAVASVTLPLAKAENRAFPQPTILQNRVFGANDKVRVVVLGLNGRGFGILRALLKMNDVDVVGICDPDQRVLDWRAKQIESSFQKKVFVEPDFHKIYDNKTIDAVAIATPNHWHALLSIYACQAGKDVYVEKPATHNIVEGRKLIEAAYRYNRIVQNGIQMRSFKATQELVRHLHNGLIGRVYMARGIVYKRRIDIGNKGISKVPQTLDYDLWCGPAPLAPFTENLVHYNWHWHWNYGNGEIGNQGSHQLDLCMWGLNVGLPERISSIGGKFLWDDCKEVPEVQTTVYHYPKEKKIIQFDVRNWCSNEEDGISIGNIFYGDKGYIVTDGDGFYQSFMGEKREKGPGSGREDSDTDNGDVHIRNWIDAVKAHDMRIQNGPVETAHLSSSMAHLGNISYRLGRQLHFDPVAERFIGDADANHMLSREYRAPYLLPDKI